MKYYYNEQTNSLLIDANDFTPYLTRRGYVEISEEEYYTKADELNNQYRLDNPEEFEEGEE